VGARFSAHVQTGPGAHPASCTIGTETFLGVENGRGVTLTPQPLLVPRSNKQSRVIPLLFLRAFLACKMVKPEITSNKDINIVENNKILKAIMFYVIGAVKQQDGLPSFFRS
jgi:hypothetical protein